MRAMYVDKDIPRALVVKALQPLWPQVIWSPFSPVGVEQVPDPELPGPRWLRIRNFQCGICATDLTLLHLKPDPGVSAVAIPGIQRIYLGHENVGEVTEVGSEVRNYSVGDRVVFAALATGTPNCETLELLDPCHACANGWPSLCENASDTEHPLRVGGGWGDTYITHEAAVRPVPGDLSNDQASLIEPAACALRGVLRRVPEPGDHVLIVGAGIIGLLTLQSVKAIAPQTHVTIMARYPQQIEAAKRLGADEIVTSGDFFNATARITGADYFTALLNRGMVLGGYSIIYDCVGGATTIGDGLRCVRAGGTLVVIGITLEMMKLDISPIYIQEVDLIGSNTYGIEHWDGRDVHTFDLVIEMFQDGRFKDQGLITHRFPFERIKEAIHTSEDKRSGSIKVTITYP